MAITISGVRFSYCHLFQPKPPKNPGEKARYSVTVLVPKSNPQAKALIDQDINRAYEDGVSRKWNGIRPPKYDVCVYDGDGVRPSDGMPFGEECRGMWVFTANSTDQPFVVDCNVQPILRAQDVYSGMWGNVNVAFFPYENSGKKGIGCALNGVQKVRDDEPLAGRVTAEEAFQVVQGAATPGAAPAGSWGAPAAPAAAAANPAWGQTPAAPVPGWGAPPAAAWGQPAAGYQTPGATPGEVPGWPAGGPQF